MNKIIIQDILVGATYSGKRLDIFIAEKCGVTRSAAQKLASAGLITVNGDVAKSNRKLVVGDKVLCLKSSRNEILTEIPVLYQDDDIIVIDKPSGVTTHPAPGEKDLTVSELLQQPIYVVHRLDKGTSGVMVLARNEKAAMNLKKQFHDRKVKKVYKALASGNIADNQGSIDISLGRSLNARGKIIPVHDGRGAVTDFKVTHRYQDWTLLEAMPKTGRTHQIRTHFSSIGHPLYGDLRYGSKEQSRVFLHAYSLAFMSPRTSKLQEFISPLPNELAMILSMLPD